VGSQNRRHHAETNCATETRGSYLYFWSTVFRSLYLRDDEHGDPGKDEGDPNITQGEGGCDLDQPKQQPHPLLAILKNRRTTRSVFCSIGYELFTMN